MLVSVKLNLEHLCASKQNFPPSGDNGISNSDLEMDLLHKLLYFSLEKIQVYICDSVLSINKHPDIIPEQLQYMKMVRG